MRLLYAALLGRSQAQSLCPPSLLRFCAARSTALGGGGVGWALAACASSYSEPQGPPGWSPRACFLCAAAEARARSPPRSYEGTAGLGLIPRSRGCIVPTSTCIGPARQQAARQTGLSGSDSDAAEPRFFCLFVLVHAPPGRVLARLPVPVS
jgi:hypothetical protein